VAQQEGKVHGNMRPGVQALEVHQYTNQTSKNRVF